MRFLIPVLGLAATLFLPALSASAETSGAAVKVGPLKTGDWEVAYTFDEPQSVLAFARSDNDYRSATWTLETEDAQFGRVNDVDVIVFDEPSKSVTFSIIPLTSTLQADYTPFIPFGDGGLAVFEGQFSLVPFASLEDVEALEDGLEGSDTAPLDLTVSLSSDQPIIVDGETFSGSVDHKVSGDGTYIYLGDSQAESFESFTAVLDKTLPEWLETRFADDLEDIFSRLEALWGFSLTDKATIILANRGLTAEGMSNTGGALDGLIMMEVSGKALLKPDANTLNYLQWFFAHEAVHLFQTANGATMASSKDAWIHEGAANTMAYSLIASKMDNPEPFLKAVYSNAFNTCATSLSKGSLETAAGRDDTNANYACGDLIALATDGYLKRRNLYEFWQRLVTNAASMDDKAITKPLYFTTMQLLGATGADRKRIRSIVEDKQDNPRKALTELLETAGLDPEFDGKGNLVKMNWPVYAAE